MSTSLTNFGTVTTKDVLARRFYLNDSDKNELLIIESVGASIDIDSGVTLAIRSAAEFNIVSEKDMEIDVSGGLLTITNNNSTSESATKVESLTGGVQIEAAATKDLALEGGQITLKNRDDVANAILIQTNKGSAETIHLHNNQGTAANSIKLASTKGGIDIDASTTLTVDVSDRAINIGNDDTINITGARTITVGEVTTENLIGNRDTNLTADDDLSIGGTSTLTVIGTTTENLTGARTSTLLGSDKLVIGQTKELEVTGHSTEVYTLNQTVTVNGDTGYTLDVAKNINIDADKNAANAIVLNASNAAGGIDV